MKKESRGKPQTHPENKQRWVGNQETILKYLFRFGRVYKTLQGGEEEQPRKPKNKNQAQNVSCPPPVCTYLTYLHGSHLTPSLENPSPGFPQHPAGARKRTGGSCGGNRRKVLRRTVYFYSWLKNSSNFFKFRSLRPGGAGPGGEAAARGACSVWRVEMPLPTRACVGAQTLSARPGTEPREGSGETKRKMNTQKIFLLVFFCLFCVLGRRSGEEKGKINQARLKLWLFPAFIHRCGSRGLPSGAPINTVYSDLN